MIPINIYFGGSCELVNLIHPPQKIKSKQSKKGHKSLCIERERERERDLLWDLFVTPFLQGLRTTPEDVHQRVLFVLSLGFILDSRVLGF